MIATKKVILAEPNGFCAGVRRAIDIVERALEIHGAPVYVRKEIVHNHYVIRALEQRGARFVDSEDEVPEGALCVFSAHGVAPAVRLNARRLGLRTIDATCPLVSKVHQEAQRFDRAGRTILLVGHANHEEVEGTRGEAPERTVVIESADEARHLDLPADTPVGVLTQTTLSVDETSKIVDVLRDRFQDLVEPPGGDICYASTNRQNAIKAIAGQSDLILVVGSRNSSNSVRMVEVARDAGVPAYLVPEADDLDESWLDGVETVGVSAGASAPSILVEQLLDRLAGLGYADIEIHNLAEETLTFALPPELTTRRAAEPVS
ncbi:MAG TPA: 4-hydroxy-3-methylbut-2-enyl diphosphate reductase [Micromonospora sp.]|nr:4-hydroxy-3-methylbut-2-enyl diphosphate reductase [Micromonospora sp.]